MVFKRISLPLFLTLIFLFMLVSSVAAIEVPPPSIPTYIQTNGSINAIGNADWYSASTGQSGAGGYHYLEINIPCGWPSTTPVHIDLFSPEMNSNAPSSDEQDGVNPGNTEFELYGVGTSIGPGYNNPAPGAPGSIFTQTYTPSGAAQQWVRFTTLNAPVTCGTYVLRAATLGDDQNGWRLRVGSDNNADPTNPPPANYDNPDGIAGTNDEITIGATQISYQHNVGSTGTSVNECLTLYEFIPPGMPSVVFNNFDMDGVGSTNNRVRYYAPTDASYTPLGDSGGIPGSVSGSTVWNNGGDIDTRVGDTVTPTPPQTTLESGWWRIVTCINESNQYIQEAQDGIPAFYQQPPTPQMTIVKDDGLTTVTAGQQITYTITFTNTSSGATAGAANNVLITDTLPANATFVSAAFGAGFTGTITSPPVGNTGTVTFAVSGAVNAGATGTVNVTVLVNGNATGTVTNTAQIDYRDGLGNQFAPVTDNDVDNIAQTQPGSINGIVFNDTNGNGTQDPGETGIANIDITVSGPGGTFNLITDVNGNYSQTQLTPGIYSIDVNTADPDLPAGATLTTGNDPASVTVPAGGNAAANFGFGTPASGSINGTVYNDTNGNGVQDPGETGIPSITVIVSGPGGTFNLTTDGSGNYSQTGLTPGSYTVDVDTTDPDLPADSTLTTANDPATVIVPSGGSGTANFGFRVLAPGSIAGNMFIDTNGNGVRDPGETGVSGVTVVLTGADINGTPVSLTTTTDGSGNYLFTGLEAGTYTVTAPPQAGYTFTTPGAVTVTLPANGTGTANFGIIPPTGTAIAAQPTLSLTDPFITKSVNPPFAVRGEQVTWTITVTNPGTVAATNVNVSDTLPGEVAIQSVTASSGTASFDGQRVTFTQPSLGAGQTVTITVVTRVRDDAPLPFTITNLASVTNAENPTPRTAQATVVSAGQLPETGEVPARNWRLAIMAFASVVVIYMSVRWFRSH